MYLAVKLMDMYISNTKQMLNKSILQLIPCAAVLIASKFEVVFIKNEYLILSLGALRTNYRRPSVYVQVILDFVAVRLVWIQARRTISL